MAKKKGKLKKLYFEKAPPGTGYFANHVHLVPEKMAKEFVKGGYARQTTQTLPEDLPGREAFIAAGIETLDEIKELDDLTELKGIGEATAEEVIHWFKENG
jgi:predicted flap endonuclease-1-like 5' DNA nuclease